MSTRKAVNKELRRVRDAHLEVRILRRTFGVQEFEGYVIDVGRRWVLLWDVWGGMPNGWLLIPKSDVKKIYRRKHQRFSRRVLELQQLWPPAGPPCQFDLAGTTRDVIETAAHGSPLVSVLTEGTRPDVLWIGRPVRWGTRKFTWLDVKPSGRWATKTRTFRISDISRVGIAGVYEKNVNAVAGPPLDLNS